MQPVQTHPNTDCASCHGFTSSGPIRVRDASGETDSYLEASDALGPTFGTRPIDAEVGQGGKPQPLYGNIWERFTKRWLGGSSSMPGLTDALTRRADIVEKATDTESGTPEPLGGKPTPLCGNCWYRRLRRFVESTRGFSGSEDNRPAKRSGGDSLAVGTNGGKPTPLSSKPSPLCAFCWERRAKRWVAAPYVSAELISRTI